MLDQKTQSVERRASEGRRQGWQFSVGSSQGIVGLIKGRGGLPAIFEAGAARFLHLCRLAPLQSPHLNLAFAADLVWNSRGHPPVYVKLSEEPMTRHLTRTQLARSAVGAISAMAFSVAAIFTVAHYLAG